MDQASRLIGMGRRTDVCELPHKSSLTRPAPGYAFSMLIFSTIVNKASESCTSGCRDGACMHDVLCQAISAQRVLAVEHRTGGRMGIRVVEPYRLCASQVGGLVLHCRQIEGPYDETAPPAWCQLPLADLRAVTRLKRFFDSLPPDDQPPCPPCHWVLCQVPR